MRFFLQWHVQGWCLLVLFLSRYVSSLVGRPMMFGIMAGMDQKNMFRRSLFVAQRSFSMVPDCSSDH